MKFNITEEKLRNREYKSFVIDDKFEFKALKRNIIKGEKICVSLDESAINLSQKLYGNSKSESVKIQKENCKNMLKLYKTCKKLIKFLRSKKVDFQNCFYCSNLTQKKNNNDFMLIAMLETYFCFNPFQRIGKANEFACEFLDKENELNKMCDFQDSRCRKDREKNAQRFIGCCPQSCKYTKNSACEQKCLACKIFMCNYLEEKGYYFTPNTIAILKLNLTFFERFVSGGLLFKPLKVTTKRLWLARGIEFFYIFAVVLALLVIFSVI